MNEERIKLALKHKLAMAYSVELAGRSELNLDAIPNKAFYLAEAMIQRIDKELSALMHTQPEPQEDLVNVLMAALMKSARG